MGFHDIMKIEKIRNGQYRTTEKKNKGLANKTYYMTLKGFDVSGEYEGQASRALNIKSCHQEERSLVSVFLESTVQG